MVSVSLKVETFTALCTKISSFRLPENMWSQAAITLFSPLSGPNQQSKSTDFHQFWTWVRSRDLIGVAEKSHRAQSWRTLREGTPSAP
jgi:hypothetical protein